MEVAATVKGCSISAQKARSGSRPDSRQGVDVQSNLLASVARRRRHLLKRCWSRR